MSDLTIDFQLVGQTCDHCKAEFQVSRGCVYNEDELVGLYLAGMHGCQRRLVMLGVALRENLSPSSPSVCFLLRVRLAADEIQMTVTNPKESPWKDEAHMGSMLSREEALAHPLITSAFQVADEITLRNPVYSYLTG